MTLCIIWEQRSAILARSSRAAYLLSSTFNKKNLYLQELVLMMIYI